MTNASRWQPAHPERIQLYSLGTPNGRKAAIALEELELPYEAHRIDILNGDQFDPAYVAIQPNSKIPAIRDPEGPDGDPITIMESGAILHYLARKTGRLMPTDARGENEVLQWLFFQVGSVGPMFGQLGHFVHARGKTDAYGETRYTTEVARLLRVLEARLEGREWLVGDFSVADIATAPWVDALAFYRIEEAVGLPGLANVQRWLAAFRARPGVQRGWDVTPIKL